MLRFAPTRSSVARATSLAFSNNAAATTSVVASRGVEALTARWMSAAAPGPKVSAYVSVFVGDVSVCWLDVSDRRICNGGAPSLLLGSVILCASSFILFAILHRWRGTLGGTVDRLDPRI
jgi:hypothetical protein